MGKTGEGAPIIRMASAETRFSCYHLFQLPLRLPPRNDSKEPTANTIHWFDLKQELGFSIL